MKIIQVTPNTQEWLEARKQGIGGSDAAAAVGLSKWKTPYHLWKEKLDINDFSSPTLLMRVGHALEDLVRQVYSETTGATVKVPNGIFMSDKYPFMMATIDGFIDGTKIIYEGKVAMDGYEWGEEGADDIPLYYLIQCQHNMIVTETDECHVGVFFRNIGQYRTYIIKKDKDLQENLIESEKQFWQHVMDKTVPELKLEDMKDLYAISKDSELEANEDCLNIVEEIKQMKSHIKQAEIDIEETELWIKEFMKDNERLIDLDGETIISWKTTKPKKTIDTTKLKKEMPETYNKYLKQNKTQRRFLIKT